MKKSTLANRRGQPKHPTDDWWRNRCDRQPDSPACCRCLDFYTRTGHLVVLTGARDVWTMGKRSAKRCAWERSPFPHRRPRCVVSTHNLQELAPLTYVHLMMGCSQDSLVQIADITWGVRTCQPCSQLLCGAIARAQTAKLMIPWESYSPGSLTEGYLTICVGWVGSELPGRK